jgi:hypothetical protein
VKKRGQDLPAPSISAPCQVRLGPLYTLRGRVVHEGVHPTIHVRVLDLMGAIYWDLLLDILGLTAQRAAGRIHPAQDSDDRFPWPRLNADD